MPSNFSRDDLDAIQLKVISEKVKNYDHIKAGVEICLPPMTAKKLVEYINRIHQSSCGSTMTRGEILNAVIAEGVERFLREQGQD